MTPGVAVEVAWRSAWPKRLLSAAIPAVVLVGTLVGSSYDLRLLTVAGIYGLLVQGYQFIFGRAGGLSLAQGAFFGLGAYVTGLASTRYGWGFGATFPLSILLPVLLASLVSIPILRLESHYFALATLGLAQVLPLVAVNAQDLTGGANGLPGVSGVVLFGHTMGRGVPMVAMVWAVVAAGALLAWVLLQGAFGLALDAVREEPLIARASGLDIGRLRLAAFLLSAGYAGAAGALYAHTLRIVSPEVLGFPVMVTCLAMAVIGGRGRIAGALIGALLLVYLPEWLRDIGTGYRIAFGVLLLACVIVAPNGLLGLLPGRPRAVAPMPMAMPPVRRHLVLRAERLAKRFGGVEAIADVSLEVRPGEILGVIGPNGAGKTTLVNLLTGVERVDRGRVWLNQVEITAAAIHHIARLGLARSFQAAFAGDFSALQQVMLGAGAIGPAKSAAGRAQAWLDRLSIGALGGRRLADLAPAEARLVDLARALALDPGILLLDEPAAGLDPAERADLAALLRVLADEGRALLIIEHDMRFLMELADRVLCLDGGRIVAEGTPAAIRADPRVRAVYLGDE